MKKKIYISGPITGYDLEERHRAFEQAERIILNKGHIPSNPMKNGLPDSANYSDHMREDLKMLLDCDEMALLDGWGNSVGCAVEVNVASHSGIKVNTLKQIEKWI